MAEFSSGIRPFQPAGAPALVCIPGARPPAANVDATFRIEPYFFGANASAEFLDGPLEYINFTALFRIEARSCRREYQSKFGVAEVGCRAS